MQTTDKTPPQKNNGLNPDRNNAALSLIIHRHSLETIVRYEIKWTATFFSHSHITHTYYVYLFILNWNFLVCIQSNYKATAK